ncbi:MAG: TldD/PmbA family protein [Candidatus Heimdallarchaeota archaeon]|nr:TldD/PmbA family protein [Candidatus Heimdallarchaeota archaeon]
MLDTIMKGIEYGRNLHVDFIDIRYQNKYIAQYTSKDGELAANTGSRSGLCARVITNGALGFASTTSTKLSNLKTIIKQASKLAEVAAPTLKEKIAFAEVKPYKDTVISPQIKSIENISVTEKINLIKDAEKVFKDFEEVKSYVLNYSEIIDNKIIANSDGTEISQKTMIPTILAQAIASKETKIAPYHEAWSKAKGFELIDEHPLAELAKFASEMAIKNLSATLPPGGPTKVLIDHTSVGIIAHEAVGHCSEADLVEGGSFLKGKLGQKVVSELITIVDEPVMNDASGWLMYDDEGTKGKKVNIIKNGILTGFLNNREFAAKMNMEPTGNARAFNFDDEPLVRMRNTYIKPGDMSDEELIEVIKDGLFVTGMMNGSADTSGEFMVGTGQAIEIKNGKLTDKIYIGPTMTGNAFEVLSSTLGVGKELKMNIGTGMCGKEQAAKVDAGGGRLACTVILGGH